MCSAAADVLLARSAASSRGRGMRAGEPVELASAAAAAPAPAQTPAPAPAPLAPPPAPGPRARRRDDDEVPPPEPFGAAPAPLAHAILHHKKHQWQFQIAATPTLWSSGPSCYSRRSVARAAAQLRICTLCERPDSHLVAAAQSTPRPRAGRVPRFPSSTLSAARGAFVRARLWLGNNTGPGLGLGCWQSPASWVCWRVCGSRFCNSGHPRPSSRLIILIVANRRRRPVRRVPWQRLSPHTASTAARSSVVQSQAQVCLTHDASI